MVQHISCPPKGWVRLWEHHYDETSARALFEAFQDGLAWQHRHIKMFGRRIPQPRLTAFYGEPGVVYTYSGLSWTAVPWSAALERMADQISDLAEVRFNSVLCNLYRDGQDSMGWHRDNESSLGPQPTIASVSLGASRRFDLRPIRGVEGRKISLELTSGSLLLMGGQLQQYWEHQIPKTRQTKVARINLTFRRVMM